MTEWLVRTQKNQILGPYSLEEVKSMVESQKLQLQDEVCPSAGFWFFLHDKKEVARQLGIGSVEATMMIDRDAVTDPFISRESLEAAAQKASVKDPEVTSFVASPTRQIALDSSASDPGSHTQSSNPGQESRSESLNEAQDETQMFFQRWFWVGVIFAVLAVALALVVRRFFGSM